MNQSIYFIACCFIILISSLNAQEKPEIVVTSGHISNVFSINFSHDNRFIVTGGMDKTVRVWDRSLAQEFRVLYGHTSSVWQTEYTSDNQHIISLDQNGQLITWKHATGEIVKRNNLKFSSLKFTYIPNTSRVLIMRNGKMEELDIFTGAVIAEHGTVTDAEIRLTKDGDHLLTRLNTELHSIGIYNYKTKEVVGQLDTDHKEAPVNIAISPNGKQVAAFSIANQMITCWDLDSRKIITSFKFPSKDVKKMEFTPDNKDLIVLRQGAAMYVYGVKSGKLKRIMNDGSTDDPEKMKNGAYCIGVGWDMAISPDSKMIAVAQMQTKSEGKGQYPEIFMGGILFDYKKNKELGRLKGYFKMSSHLSVAPNGKYLINSTIHKHPGLRVWNMKEGDLERFIPTSGVAGASADGAFFAAWALTTRKDKPALTVYSTKSLKTVFENFEVDALSDICLNADGSIMLTQEVYVDLKDYTKNKFFFRVWDVLGKKQIGKRIEFSNMEMPGYKSLKLSPDGKYIIAQINSSEITCWEIATGKRIQSRPSQIAYEFILDFVPNSTKVLISTTKPELDMATKGLKADMNWFEWDYLTGEESGKFNTGKEGILFSGDFSDDGQFLVTGQGGYFNEINFDVVIWDWATKKPVCTMPGHHGEIKFVWFGAKNKRVFTTAEDGFIKVWDIGSCELASSMIAQGELDYLILSPDNYYKTSKGNNEGIGFRFKNSLYTVDQFDVRFNRPDKVLTSLGVSKYSVKLYTKAWEKRVSKLGFSPENLAGELALPNIELTDKSDIPVTTEEKRLKLNVKAWDETHQLDRISVYVNDVPAPQLKGISLTKQSTNKIDQELNIDLSTGKNIVKISVFNENGLESLRESFQINYTPTTEKKPDLYIFTIGVSEFSNKERNLKFAAQDATDLVNKFQASNYFGNVHTEQIFNENATKENVIKAAKFFKKAQTDDQILIYVSSHGLLDEKLDYYLAMHDVDFENPAERGLPYDAINNMLDGMNCRNRLIMIDACHSGEVDKDEMVTRSSIAATNSNVKINHKSGTTLIRPKAGLKNSFSYMKNLFNDVSKGTGATVISAAGGYEFALESEDWNNGVFTYSILQGLTSGDADRNGDGDVYVSELKDYVTLQVIKLTDGKQHPTTRSENALNDFILFKVPKRYDKKLMEED